jgi:excinuclease ABC subunit A
VAEGTPEHVAAEPRSFTGQYLKPLLDGVRAEINAVKPVKKRRKVPVREREAAE